jgi:Ca2+-binding RTX toxin-like protein
VIDGGAGDDMLWGQSGDDTLYGGSGDDVIVAGSGRTAILPGEGNDTVFAGDGADHIYIEERSGWDQIYDFQDRDLLDFSGSNLFGRLSDLIHRVYDDGENTRINVSEDVGVMLIGVTTSNLTLDNFSV